MDEVVAVEVEEVVEGVDVEVVDMVVTEVATKVVDIGVELVTVVDMELEVVSKVECMEQEAMEMTMLLLSIIMATMVEVHMGTISHISNLLVDKEEHVVEGEEDIVHINWYVF